MSDLATEVFLSTEPAKVALRLSAGGLAFASKLRGGVLRDLNAEVLLHRQQVTLDPYPHKELVGIFDEGRTFIQSQDEVTARRDDARHQITSVRRRLWWDHLDLLYFAGYALWNYVALPFQLARVPQRDLGVYEHQGESLRRVEVTFPKDIHTHSRLQTFYLDNRDRIRRHDYTAEVFGHWARAAHFCWAHKRIDTVWIATRRRVVPRARGGRVLPGPTLVWIRLEDLHLRDPP